jgi:hypothetical protein
MKITPYDILKLSRYVNGTTNEILTLCTFIPLFIMCCDFYCQILVLLCSFHWTFCVLGLRRIGASVWSTFMMCGWQNPLNQLQDFRSDKRKMLSVAGKSLCDTNSFAFTSEVLQIMCSCLTCYPLSLLREYISVSKHLVCSTVLYSDQN